MFVHIVNFTFRSIIISMQTHVKEPKSFNFNANTCKRTQKFLFQCKHM